MPEAYLTIDDSPTPRIGSLLDFLNKRGLQAMFFSRGDFIEERFEDAVDIIRGGHILANHLYSHQPTSQLGYEIVIKEIERTEGLIDKAYKASNVLKSGCYIRFPYLDRGDGEKAEQKLHDIVHAVQSGSYEPDVVSELTQRLQTYLKQAGYRQPFPDVNHPLYQVDEIANAADCMLTYTSYDWMLSPRHRGQRQYKTLQELKEKIDSDDHLLLQDSVNIVLFHDDREGVVPEVCALIDHMLERGLTFRKYQT